MKQIFTAIRMSFGMYTVFPIPLKKWDEDARTLMLFFLPLVGLAIGVLWYVIAKFMQLLSFPNPLYAAVMVVYPYRITGFIHLDGFMDCCDAILSRRPREEKQRILKDPHVGAFAVISLAILFLLCFAFFLSGIETAALEALIFIPASARCSSAWCVFNLEPMAHSQFAGGFRKKNKALYRKLTAAALLLYLAGAFAVGGLGTVVPTAVSAAGCLFGILYARSLLGGMSGDVAGYGTVIGEAAALAAMTIKF